MSKIHENWRLAASNKQASSNKQVASVPHFRHQFGAIHIYECRQNHVQKSMAFRVIAIALDPLTYGNVVKILFEIDEFDNFSFGFEALLSALPALHAKSFYFTAERRASSNNEYRIEVAD